MRESSPLEKVRGRVEENMAERIASPPHQKNCVRGD
jgi:hypothetical protein